MLVNHNAHFIAVFLLCVQVAVLQCIEIGPVFGRVYVWVGLLPR